LAIAETEIGAGLGFVKREDMLDRFDLDQDGALDDDVCEEALFQAKAFACRVVRPLSPDS
jgi:hypothetical protein